VVKLANTSGLSPDASA